MSGSAAARKLPATGSNITPLNSARVIGGKLSVGVLGRRLQRVHEILKRTQLVEFLNSLQCTPHGLFPQDSLAALNEFCLNVGSRERILRMAFHFAHELAQRASVMRLHFDDRRGGEGYGVRAPTDRDERQRRCGRSCLGWLDPARRQDRTRRGRACRERVARQDNIPG